MNHITECIRAYNERLTPGEPPMTQRRLADLVGTSESLVSRHVAGDTQMTFETARRYADTLGCRAAQIDDRFFDVQGLPTSAKHHAA